MVDREEVQDRLASYIADLATSAKETTHAADRGAYTSHLAEAARMFAVCRSGSLEELRAIVKSQRRAFGWGYLAGDPGTRATTAFDRFATFVEGLHDAG
jgi:hypothetical protein